MQTPFADSISKRITLEMTILLSANYMLGLCQAPRPER